MKHLRRLLTALTLLLIAALAAGPAFGSAIIGRNVTAATLSIDRQDHAHVSYRSGGRSTSLVASGIADPRIDRRVQDVDGQVHRREDQGADGDDRRMTLLESFHLRFEV